MAQRFHLQSTDGKSSITLLANATSYELILESNVGKVTKFELEGLPILEFTTLFEDTSNTRIFAQTDLAMISIVVTDNIFDICIRNFDAPFVGLETSIEPHSWYGLGHFMRQSWPLEKLSLDFGPFYTFDVGSTGLCTQIDPTLISTSGSFLKVDDSSPCLHLGFNSGSVVDRPDRDWTNALGPVTDFLPSLSENTIGNNNRIRVESRKSFDWPHVDHPWMDKKGEIESYPLGPELRFQLSCGNSVKEACETALKQILTSYGPRKSIPPVEMMKHPIWTTWARYGPDINQEKVLRFAEEIVSRNLPRTIMEIDDMWSPKYGEIEFDRNKFPDPESMVDKLHNLGFNVTLWVMPFAQPDSKGVMDKETEKFYMQNEDDEVGFFKWWQPFLAAGIDVMNLDACDWFVSRLELLQNKYGIDGFKFDAGEAYFIPPRSKLVKDCRVPAEYTRKYIENIASRFHVSEVRAVVQGCQHIAPMVRMLDRYSTWNFENGLASVITSTLTSSVLGYPFSLPDMIGGNAYGDQTPNAELMIRWAQLTAALPSMQFSLAPWDYGEMCDSICTNVLEWRSKVFWKYIEPLIEPASRTYHPIIRPLWWVDDSSITHHVDDEFLIGDDLLVAPVTEKDSRIRKVTFPAGKWIRLQLPGVSQIHKATIFKGRSSVSVDADIDDMPVFQRI